ncbi:hypothetical protein Nepgr_009606 [Nepenthes gracilis]|uniref:RING-type domain-containing protein n=1 Tax=Nepenthes gracilis TaxID=150966 RepID=A0AAD3SBC7_NEPGR|nr:hypothetical protein Nepgr_009606 [Nepenthes gracilis]
MFAYGWKWPPAASYKKLRTPTAFHLQTISNTQAFGLQTMVPIHVEDLLPSQTESNILPASISLPESGSLRKSSSLRESNSLPESVADTLSSCHSSVRIHFIDPTFLETLPVVSHREVKDLTTKDDGGGWPLECAVCWSPFQDDHTVRLIPKCNPSFHWRCVDPWIAFHATCPLCLTSLAEETGCGVSLPSDSSMSSLLDEIEDGNGASGAVVRGDENV